MMPKELQNSDLIYVNLMTDVFKIIVKYRWKISPNISIYTQEQSLRTSILQNICERLIDRFPAGTNNTVVTSHIGSD